MKTTIKILNLKRIPTTGFVVKVDYSINFELEGETDRKIGSIKYEVDETSTNLIPFEELTEEIVLGWVNTSLGEEELSKINTEFKTKLEQKIKKKSNHEFISGTPWKK
jgi:hypothetical protein